MPGFCLRIRPTGTKFWYFRYRAPGGPQRREAAAENLRFRQSTRKTFIAERYERWGLTYLRTDEFQLERIRADFAEWLDKPLADLSPWLIDQWRKRQIATGMAPVTVNRNLQRLRTAEFIDHVRPIVLLDACRDRGSMHWSE